MGGADHAPVMESPTRTRVFSARRGIVLSERAEAGLLAAIGVLILATRLLEVAAKPLHHDESLFAYYGYFLYKGFGYVYQPILHGAVLQNVSALFFLLFGDSQLVMRLPAILGGLLLFVVFWFWRRYIGRWGVVVAIAFAAFSPTLAYYSRFLRNDVPYLTATVWCALCTLRALQTGERRYWMWAVLSAALMFSMMESSIFFFASCWGFLAVAVVTDFIQGRGIPADAPRSIEGGALLFIPRVRGESESGLPIPAVVGAVFTAALAEIVLAWLYHRMFADTLRVFDLLGRACGVPPDAAAFGFAVAAFPVFTALCLIVAANYRRPYGLRGVLHYFLRLCAERRWTIVTAAAAGVAFYAAVFTTWFTNTAGTDFWGREVLLTPLQIYKNTWDYWIDQHSLHASRGRSTITGRCCSISNCRWWPRWWSGFSGRFSAVPHA